MPLRFRIDGERDLVVTTADGLVTGGDLQEHALKLTSTPNRPLRELVDLSGACKTNVSAKAVQRMATWLAEREEDRPGSMLALVAGSESIYGMLRMFEAYRDRPHLSTRVFRDTGDAMSWLEQSPEPL